MRIIAWIILICSIIGLASLDYEKRVGELDVRLEYIALILMMVFYLAR